MSDLLSILGSGLGGGVLGVVGATVNKFIDFKSFDKRTAAELAKQAAEYAHKEKMADIAGKEKDFDALMASIAADKATYSAEAPGEDGKLLRIADFIRALVRPGLTLYFTIFNSGLLAYIVYKYGFAITAEQAYQIANSILVCLLSCSSLAIGWWFGARRTI